MMSILSPHQPYDALGPFPLGTRELPFLSSPLYAFATAARVVDPFLTSPVGARYPSAYGLNGSASWAVFRPDNQGWLDVTWSSVDWAGLRQSEGWAGLQHLTLLRSEIDVQEPGDYLGLLVQGHSWAVVPQDRLEDPIAWHTGDIYAYSEGLGGERPPGVDVYGQVVGLEAGKHWIYLKSLYEIRMFGDPGPKEPTIRLKFSLSKIESSIRVTPTTHDSSDEPLQEVLQFPQLPSTRPIPDLRVYGPSAGMSGLGDVIGGWIYGDVAGFALRARREPVEVTSAELQTAIQGLSISLRSPLHLAPYQLRPLTLEIEQTEALLEEVKQLSLVLSTDNGQVNIVIPINHESQPLVSTVRFVYRDQDGTAAYAMAHPPTSTRGPQEAVILALHGAGVETSSAFWTDAISPRPRSWVLFPTGRTAWGYDWHAASTSNVWAARRELSKLLGRHGQEPLSDRSVVVGHSNGGQGATHLFLHYPDAFQGALSAAAYLKIQAYVPYTQWTSAHHADPALWGLLMTGLSSNDEDVLSVNGFGLARALVHGREDDNVPVWHGREMMGLHAQHSGNTSLITTYEEVPDESHWFESILSSSFVERFLSTHTHAKRERYPPAYSTIGFELVVAIPDEQGGKGGFRITQLDRVGRLARLRVGPINDEGSIVITSRNTLRFSLDRGASSVRLWRANDLVVDGCRLSLPLDKRADDRSSRLHDVTFHRVNRTAPWQLTTDADAALEPIRRYGPLLSILTTPGPLVLIVPARALHHLQIATRIAHDAWVYGRFDARIITDEQAKAEMRDERQQEGLQGNWIVVGGRENAMTGLLQSTPLHFPGRGLLSIRTADGEIRTYDPTNHPSTGVLCLHPHPLARQGLALILAGTDAAGLERAFRLFPVRTGTPSLDWMIVGQDADWKGAGGLLGAGWWDNDWGWEESGSWLA